MGEARGMKSAKTYIVAGLLFVYCTVVSLVTHSALYLTEKALVIIIFSLLQVYVFVNDPTFHEV